MDTFTTALLSELRTDDAANARKSSGSKGLPELMASIKAIGLLQPIVVRKSESTRQANGLEKRTYRIVDGRRRFDALKKLNGKKEIEIPIMVREADDRAAREASLAANVVRVNLHPVDEYEAYKALIDGGLTAEEIGKRFGVKEKWVRQRLQLADLAPELREAWRAGKMAADQAEALTSSPDHARQIKTWKEAGGQGREYLRAPEYLRRSLRSHGYEQEDARVKAIGLDAYAARGGRMTEDLFVEKRLLIDRAIVDALVEETIEAECVKYLDQGWAWALPETKLPCRAWEVRDLDLSPWMTEDERALFADTVKVNWKAREKADDAASERAAKDPEAKKKSGVVVSLAKDGFAADLFRVLPSKNDERPDDNGPAPDDDEPETSGLSPKADAADAPKINYALRESLSEVLTIAVSRALESSPALAVELLIASLRTSLDHYATPNPLRVSTSDAWKGLVAERNSDGDWIDAFARVHDQRATAGELLEQLGRAVMRLIDLRAIKFDHDRGNDWTDRRDGIVATITDALPAAEINREIAAAFDPGAYFDRVSAADCAAAFLEMNRGVSSALPKKKAEIAAVCAAKAKETGWLPPELRTVHYAGSSARLKDAAE